jgi:two-component system cell cycle sensor histidine kinase/response regulator CckA
MNNETERLRCQVEALQAEILSLKQKQHSSMQDSRSHIACEQAALDLQEEMKFRETFIQSLPGFFVAINSEGKTVFINDSMLQAIGYNRDEVVGKDYLATLVPESEREKVSRVFQELIHQNEPTISENHIVAKDGKELLMEWQGRYVLHENGKVDCFYGVGTNITNRKRSEEALRESESKYRRLYDSMMEAFVNTDMSGRIQETNRAFQILVGYSEDKLKQLYYTDLTPEKWHVFESEIVKNQIIPHGYSDVYEKEYRKKDGTIFPVELRTFLLRGASGQPIGMWAIIRDITERKRAEKQLDEWRKLMDFIIRHDPNAIAVYDENLRYIFVSERYLDDYKVKDRNIIGKHHYEVFPEMPERWKQVHQRVLAGAVERAEEDRFERLDGSVDYNRWECRPWYRLDGSVGGMITYSEVITERKRSEDGLRESEARFRVVIEDAPDAIFVQSEGRFAYLNPAACRLLGASGPKDLLGKHFMERIAPEYHNRIRERIRLQLETGETAVPMEQTYLRLDGSQVPVETTAVSIRYQGEDAHLVFVRDITDRKKAEENLRLSQARYRTLVENIPQRVLLKDRESNYISINQAYGRAFGLNPEDIIGKSDYDIHPRNLADKFRQEDRLVMETGESREFQEENVEGGKTRLLHKVKVPVRDSMGKIIGVLSAISDITERLQLEEQFRHSQKMEAVGRLAGGVAHDFNNLLTVIGGHTEIALTRIDKNNPLHDSLQEVKIASDRAASLTRQLLAFSRRQVMEIKVLNLNTVIRDTEKMLRRLLGEDIAVITQPSETLGLVKADPGQIEQVLTNLAVNARDAMAEGGRLVIATDNLEITEADDPTNAGLKPGRYVRISVSDTGHGMNPEVISKIFEPFFTTKEQGKGTGLGLSTVFGIVKQSGGEIRVQSELEKGTTFGIILPRVEEAEPVIGKKDLKEPPRGTETVLIIEDEKSVLKMAAQLLKNQGYQIIEAPGSEDAMRVFEEHSGPIDLVLTDVVMPVCRGPALVERLKQLRDNFKVLYMSGYTDGGVGDLYVLRRGDNFIQKPFTLESLANKVRSVLDRE